MGSLVHNNASKDSTYPSVRTEYLYQKLNIAQSKIAENKVEF